MPQPNDPAVVNSWLLMWGDPRRQVSPYSPVAARLLADRLMRLAQVGRAARERHERPLAPVIARGISHATIEA